MSNKNSRGKRKELDPIDEVAIEQPVVEESVEVYEEPKVNEMLDGIVHNCVKLNVRKEPSLNSEVIAVLSDADKIKVEDIGNFDWYCIHLPNGTKGFSMKKYIAVPV